MPGILPPLRFDDPERTASSRLTVLSAWAFLGAAGIIALWLLVSPLRNARLVVLVLLVTATSGAVLALARRSPRAAAHVLVEATWLIMTVNAWIAGGMQSPAARVYLPLTFLAGLLLGSTAAVLCGLASIAATLVMTVAATQGWLPASQAVAAPLVVWLVMSIIVGLVVILQHAASTEIRRALSSYQRELAERQRTEAALRESEQRFRAMFDHAALAVTLVDAAGRPVRRNPAHLRFLGRTAEELEGHTISDDAHPEDVEPDVSLHRELIAGVREGYQIERRYRRKDGSVVWGRLTASRVPGPDGAYSLRMIEDVTAERKSRADRERLLHDLGERVKELTTLHAVANLLHAGSGEPTRLLQQIVDVLPAAFQYPAETAARLRLGEQAVSTARYVETPWMLSGVFTAADGRAGVLDVVYLREYPPEAEGPFLAEERALVNSLVELLRGSLDRNAASEALRRSEERLRIALRYTKMGIWEWDIQQDVLEWSDEMWALTGLQPGKVRGGRDDFAVLIHPEDQPAVRRAIQSALEPGATRYEVEFRYEHPDGTMLWIANIGRVYRDAADRAVRILGVSQDVTARKELEKQLQQSQKMEAVGRLAGGVAHDFNNLLLVINGYSDLLLEELPPAESAYAMARDIRGAGEKASSLTRQLLAFSRQSVLAPKVVDLNRLVGDMENLLRRLLGADVELGLNLRDVAHVRVDPGQIEHVLINLIVNARDAMPQGGHLTIETAPVELDASYADARPDVRPGRYVRLAVSDTGCGMDEATRARIFEPFFTTKPAGKGTGLGLAMVFGVIKQSDGHVEAYSEPGQGATFKVYLPAVSSPETPDRTTTKRSAPRGTETILFAEDDEMVRVLVRSTLQSLGYHVIEAVRGDEAVQIAQAYDGDIQLILTDIVMPGLSGREVAERVRASRPSAKTLYISGYTDDAVVRHGVLRAEANFLQKPFSPSLLAHRIRDVLDR